MAAAPPPPPAGKKGLGFAKAPVAAPVGRKSPAPSAHPPKAMHLPPKSTSSQPRPLTEETKLRTARIVHSELVAAQAKVQALTLELAFLRGKENEEDHAKKKKARQFMYSHKLFLCCVLRLRPRPAIATAGGGGRLTTATLEDGVRLPFELVHHVLAFLYDKPPVPFFSFFDRAPPP